MARIVEERDVPSVYEETTVRRPGAAAGPTVVDDGSGFGLGVIAGVIVAIAIAVLAVLWATGSFHGGSNNSPGSTVTSTAPGSNNNTGTTGGTGTGTSNTGTSGTSGSNTGTTGGGTTTTP